MLHNKLIYLVIILFISPISVRAQKMNIDSIVAFIKYNEMTTCNNIESHLFVGSSDRPADDLAAVKKTLLKIEDQHCDDLYIGYFSYTSKPRRFYRIYATSDGSLTGFEIECTTKNQRYSYKIRRIKTFDEGLFSLKHVKERQKDKCIIQKGSISTSNGGIGVVYQYKLGNISGQTFVW